MEVDIVEMALVMQVKILVIVLPIVVGVVGVEEECASPDKMA
jgi:hypothetical protein